MRCRVLTQAVLRVCLAFGLGLAHRQARATETNGPVELSAKLHHGRFVLPARVNESARAFSFLLDTACTITTLHPALMDELGLPESGHVRINGIAGEERAPTYKGVVFKLGPLDYAPFRVASVPSERSESRRRDGVLGSGFFRRFVVELDAHGKSVRLHSPANFAHSGKGEVLALSFREEVPVLKASICLADKTWVEAEFEVDTGCDSGLCLGQAFVSRHKLLDAGRIRADEKFGVGGSVETKSGSVPLFRMGRLEVREPQADFFVRGSPVDEPLAGHIGMGVLREFKATFDYSRKQLILER